MSVYAAAYVDRAVYPWRRKMPPGLITGRARWESAVRIGRRRAGKVRGLVTAAGTYPRRIVGRPAS